MAKDMYRYDAITKDKLRDGRSITLVIHPDVFFDEKEDAKAWGESCSYFLEKSKNGAVKIVVRDKDGKVVNRIVQKNLTDYEQETEGASIRDRISFEEMFEGLISLRKNEKNPMSIPLTRKAFCLQTFSLHTAEGE